MATEKNLAQLASAHVRYIEALKADGKRILSFDSPCCGKPIETLAPARGRTFDSIALCQHCGATYYKVVTHKKAAGYVAGVAH